MDVAMEPKYIGWHSSGSGYDKRTAYCENDKEPSGSLTQEEFLTYVRNYRLLKKDSAPRVGVLKPWFLRTTQ
jgi:hypothetical protein